MAGNLSFISADEVKSVLNYGDLIPVMEKAFRNFSDLKAGGVVQPVRTVTSVPNYNGNFGVMPAYSQHDNALAAKLVAFYPDNKEVPTHHAIIVLLEATNGVPIAILDGEVITAMRTAAASVVATQCMYGIRQPKTLAIVGAGVQGMAHYEALSRLYNFSEVRVNSRTSASAEKLASHVNNGKAYGTVEEAVKGADIIVVSALATQPILKAAWVKPGAHINAVGAARADWQELEDELVRSSILCVDSREAALVESGDIIISKAEIFAEIGEVLLGLAQIPQDGSRITLFKSLGMAIEDVVSAKLVYDKIQQKGNR